MSVLRFQVRGKNYAAITDAIADELVRFASPIEPEATLFDAEAVYIESGGGDRRLLEYVADVRVEL